MEIERINDHTVKFYISYLDIEDRGFDREEIWYNREKSEQLFWEVMDEVNDKEDFSVDGPLWIQVQAMDKGLEILVTKAQLSKDGHKIELPMEGGETIDMPVDDKIESLLDQQFNNKYNHKKERDESDPLHFVLRFQSFEDVIQLSHSFEPSDLIQEKLYSYDDKYYLFVNFVNMDATDDEQEDLLSKLLEFGIETSVTEHVLEEYGKTIFSDHVFEQIKHYFKQ